MSEEREKATATLSTRVYHRLRQDVISGALAPGSKLALEMLRERYGVGMTPLREALYRLSATLLVQAHDQRGFRVAEIGLAHFEQVVSARERLESLLLEDSIRAGDDAWAQRAARAHAALDALPMYEQAATGVLNAEWQSAHHHFHYELLSGARHFIQDMFHAILWDHSARYRNILRPEPLPEDMLKADHARLIGAVLERDVEMAVLVLRRHIRNGSSAILDVLRRSP
ncbi:GntR family transcriptional regulator [Roseomonas xinghualingensis]|uniref:GntR family transcriptional regulator n=1 Tax=Roseomonas xinghualingensis TaxID=2986475 RepID=UPI0021F17250|nr:GntR family transcriptional regulator [Roseomonas sp. SXEYE001]MCV4207711.1 GntR family transcriptional regulator [Roseomonas sp. SXEYE001]